MRKPRRWIRWGTAGGAWPPRAKPMRGGCSTGSVRSAITIACSWVGGEPAGTVGRPAGERGGDVGSSRWRALAELPQRWTAPKFPLRAADFIVRGMAEGPSLGHVLTLAEDAWLAADFPLEEAALASIADQAAARVSRDERT